MKFSRFACWIALAFSAICLMAQPPRHNMSQEFIHPTHHNNNVDWCQRWSVDCGKPAADYFCTLKGYDYAVDFDARPMRPTLVLGDNRLCDNDSCKGFSRIRCDSRPQGPQPMHPSSHPDGRDGFFAIPQIGRNRVDQCLHWGVECGQPAADSFCRNQGYARAADFSIRLARPTLILGDNQICDRSDCQALENLRCVGDDREPQRRSSDWDRPAPPPPPMEHGQRFQNPSVRGYAIDRCLTRGGNCDQPAADQFCARQGFRRAVDFAVAPQSPTLILGDNQVCNYGCHAFTQITCSGR